MISDTCYSQKVDLKVSQQSYYRWRKEYGGLEIYHRHAGLVDLSAVDTHTLEG